MPEGNELFRVAVESAPNAMLMVDAEGKIVLVNAQTEELFGYPRAEILGHSIEMLVPERYRTTHPGHRHSFFAHPGTRAMGAGRDLFALRKDGTEVPVEIGLNPIQTAKGSFVLAVVVDITERKRDEERFRMAVESAPNAMLMADPRGNIVLANAQAEKLFGYSKAELLQGSIDRLVPGRFRAEHPGHRADFHAAPRSRPMGADRQLFALRKDGTEFPVEIGLNPIKTREGDFVLAAVVDLTTLKKMEGDLVRSQSLAALGEMAATVAHEVKNPLAAISGPLQILAEDFPEGDSRRELMKEILEQVRRLDRTVRGLLSFSKPTTPSRQPIVLFEFIERIARTAVDQQPSRRILVRQEGPADLTLSADPVLLEQVLWNLFLNASEAMKTGGEILVRYREEGPSIDLSVEDSGVGIPPEVVERLFRPFMTTKTSGTGLGLSLCRKIIEAHGGTIGIASTPGKGTQVRIRLPKV